MGEGDPGGQYQGGVEPLRIGEPTGKAAGVGAPTTSNQPSYTVKDVELVMAGPQVQARVFTLAPGDSIPWHYHSESTDHYFVLRGTLTIKTRDPDSEREFEIGNRHRIMPGTAHLLSNRGAMDCQFLLLQGVGKYDWIKAEG
jgi:quercetin dioxygenase-like cupin family protein